MGAASAGDWKFDNSGGDGVALGADGRANLMNALGQRAGLAPPPQASGVGAPTAAFTITNMFDPAKEDGATWRDDIKADVLNCTKFQPIIETAFHDGVCTEAVAGLYYIWQVVAAAAVFTYVGIWLVPFATAAFTSATSTNCDKRTKLCIASPHSSLTIFH